MTIPTPLFGKRVPAGVAAACAIAFATCVAGCTPVPSGTTPPTAAAADESPNANVDVLNVADAAIAGNDPTMALKVSQSVLATDPHNLDALYHEGEAYYAVGRCEDAIAAYKVALSIDPNSSDAQTGIGRCLLKQDAAAAETAFAAAVQDNPSNAAALNDLGIARDLQGKYAAAAQPYEQALMVEPGTVSTEVNLGMSEALSGDSTDALQYLGPLATGQDATPKIREDYAAALISAGRLSEAQQVLSVDLSPDQVTTFIQDVQTAITNAQAAQAAAAPVTSVPSAGTAAVTPVMATPMDEAAATPVTAAPAMAAPVVTPVAPAVATPTPPPTAPAMAPVASPPPASPAAPAMTPPPAATPTAPAISAPPPATGPDSAGSDQLVR